MSDKAIQYTQAHGAFLPCGRTQERLAPGFYEVVEVNRQAGLKPKTIVCDELIDLPGTEADEIFEDINKFMETGERYALYGMTHKRGYLFYGPPGSGKTSLGTMLARRFIERCGGVVVYISSAGALYNAVAILREIEPGRPSMYLIEEADATVNNTHSLSILDGELSLQNAVFVAMTNYKNKLPPRIANRPGRFDRVTLINCPPPRVQIEYLKRIIARGEGHEDAPERIVKALEGLPMSMAHLREAFISHVLMDIPVDKVRGRFEVMAGIRNEDGTAKVEIQHMDDIEDEPDDDEDEEYDEVRAAKVDDAKYWEPGDGDFKASADA